MSPAALLAALCVAAGPGPLPDAPQRARQMIDEGRAREAVDLLKAEPGAPTRERSLLLARGYLAQGNDFWAVRSLAPLLERDAGDCEARLWLAWIGLRQQNPAAAREDLALAACKGGPLLARQRMLEAMAHQAEGKRDLAVSSLDSAARERAAFSEDVAALEALRAAVDLAWRPPVSVRLEVAGLWTSNALAGSPTDPESGGLAESGGSQALVSLRLVSPARWFARPVLDAELKGLRYGSAEGRDQSTWQISARPGLLLDLGRGVEVAYRYEALQLAGGDLYDPGPIWYLEAHRGELEVPLPAGLVLFGGAGQRLFRQDYRTRIEADLGLGIGASPARFVHVLGALTGRAHWAKSDAYDLGGGTLLVSAEWKVGPVALRTGLLGSVDAYSAGQGSPWGTDPRRDALLKASLGLWSPAWQGLKVGGTYELAQRWSNVPKYGYTDHRVLLKVAFSGSLDPFAPRAVSPSGHVALDWAMEGQEASERVQDLLRQDESLQSGSSCVDR